jgi:hypothetical protein
VFVAVAISNGELHRDLPPDIELEVEFARAILRILPNGPSHPRQCRQERPIHGNEFADLLAVFPVAKTRQRLSCQRAQQPGQQLRIDHVLHRRKTARLTGWPQISSCTRCNWLPAQIALVVLRTGLSIAKSISAK